MDAFDRNCTLRPLPELYRLPQPAGLGELAQVRPSRRAPQRPPVRACRLSGDAREGLRGDPGSPIQYRTPGLRVAFRREPAPVRLPAQGPVSWLSCERQT